jgi:hypothetical protein
MLPLIALLLVLAHGQPPAVAPSPTPDAAKTYHIPYKLADTQHILVRAKLNGKGPYTFIMDSGAPELFFAKDTAQKIGITGDKSDEATIDKLEIEGGAVLNGMSAHIADPSQLVSMNAMGLTDTRIEGVLGYNILARFRIQLDLKESKMVWTRLDFNPPTLEVMRAAAGDKPIKPSQEFLAMENLSKTIRTMFAKKGETQTVLRGFLGIEFADGPGKARIAAVLPGSPAATGGLKAGDTITQAAIAGRDLQDVAGPAEASKLLGVVGPGDTVKLSVMRGAQKLPITLTAGKGAL